MSTLQTVPLSVLDVAPVPSGTTVGEALRASVALARHTERLGYTRFWVAEHHNAPSIASAAPPVLIGQLAAATSTIRVGSGGVMLPNHAPLVVAEQFGTLEALYPGRIDLGIGRAPGTDQVTAAALRRSEAGLSADDFPQQLTDLIAFFDGDWPENHPYAGIIAVPGLGHGPAMWLLGSSGFSAQVAGILGLPFAFAHHFSAQNTVPALRLYRERFAPSPVLDQPYAMIAVSVTAADTDEEARRLALPAALSFLRMRRGGRMQLPTQEEAEAYVFDESERYFLEERLGSQVIGSPETVRKGLEDLLDRTHVDELMITTMSLRPEDREHTFTVVAEVAGGRTPATA